MAKIIRFPTKISSDSAVDIKLDAEIAAEVNKRAKHMLTSDVERMLAEVDAEITQIARAEKLSSKIESVCRTLLRVLYRGTLKPNKFFVMYEKDAAIAFKSFNYKSEELLETIELILRHKRDTTGTADDPEEPDE